MEFVLDSFSCFSIEIVYSNLHFLWCLNSKFLCVQVKIVTNWGKRAHPCRVGIIFFSCACCLFKWKGGVHVVHLGTPLQARSLPYCNLMVKYQLERNYRSGTVNSNTVNSKFHLIRSFFEIFFYHFPNISCLTYTVNSNFHLIRSKTLLTNDFELIVPDLY